MWRSNARWCYFSESIERNIAVDDNEIDKGRLEKAAEIACIKEYVMGLP